MLVRRYGETDYDGAFSFIGGKMEGSDSSIIDALKREKDEEVGSTFRVRVYPNATNNWLYRKKDGSNMILPHYICQHTAGGVALNQAEYSEWRWIPLDDLATLEPKIESIPKMVEWAVKLKDALQDSDFVEI